MVRIEVFHCTQRRPHFRGLEYRGSTVHRGVLISRSWNRGVPLYTEVSSFQGVRIEGFHCTQRCPHFRGLVPLCCIYLGLVFVHIWSVLSGVGAESID